MSMSNRNLLRQPLTQDEKFEIECQIDAIYIKIDSTSDRRVIKALDRDWETITH